MSYNISGTILLADEDLDDCLMIRDAMKEAGITHELRIVHNGEEALDYLHHRGTFTDETKSPAPLLVLLDLKMPKKDGRETLKEIKTDPKLQALPVVILTTSHADSDVATCYALGANSYISKPVTYDGLIEVMRTLKNYWLQTVTLP